jgi:hypothetical protein
VEVLLKANLVGCYPIQVERHTLLNFSQGSINADRLDGMLNKEIQSHLAEQSVSKAYISLESRATNHSLCLQFF